MEEIGSDNESVEKKRGRKKQLHKAILSQMEFYFSTSNLSKDRWVNKKLKEESAIHLTEFLKFNKIRALTQDVNDLAKALRKSKIISVTEDMKVKRIQPIKYKENEDDYIIYIEQLPSDADHEWLTSLFSKYGNIDYISIPKFKNSNKCKGFAFLEFCEVESAEKAIKDYQQSGNYLSTDIEPAGLISIATYEEDSKVQQPVECGSEVTDTSQPLPEINEMKTNGKHKSSKKRKKSETLEDSHKEKKLKTEIFEEEKIKNKEGGNSVQVEVTTNETEEDDANASNTEHSEVMIDESKKKKNRKKKSKKKSKNKEDIEQTSLQILSKKDWKKLRNKYLNMQKEKMKQLKKHIVLARKKAELSKQSSLFKKNENSETNKVNKTGKCSFSPGLIVKVKLNEPVIEVKNLKNNLKTNQSLVYVDLKEGETTMYLRFASSEAASEFKEKSSWPKAKILKGEKEINYWNKIREQRGEKLSRNVKKKERGKDKLMRKAENILGKHITFD